MDASIAALLGGMAGGFIVGFVWQRRVVTVYTEAAAAMEALIAHHEEIERGLIERIKQLEAGDGRS